MSIKSILCIFAGTANELNALEAAFSIADTHSARLRILHISPNPSSYVGLYGEGFIESSHLVEAIERENAERLEKVKQYAVSFATQHCTTISEKSNLVTNGGVARSHVEFVHLVGDADGIIASEGRLCDVIIIGRGADGSGSVHDSVLVTALFETGRPVLLLPITKNATPSKWRGKTISIAWNGGMEAARATYHSLPFLKHADKVQILTVREGGEACNLDEEENAIRYLQCHNIRATGIIVAAGNRPPAEALLARARELQTDLLVMGAYGHSRFREMILGGITNYMLKSADIPLLLSH